LESPPLCHICDTNFTAFPQVSLFETEQRDRARMHSLKVFLPCAVSPSKRECMAKFRSKDCCELNYQRNQLVNIGTQSRIEKGGYIVFVGSRLWSTRNTPYLGESLMELEGSKSRSGISLSKSENISALFATVEVWNTARFGANALSWPFSPNNRSTFATCSLLSIDFPFGIRIL
jgi:hypothetical protein